MRYLCVHGHFYQPPRENPWLEAIEVQDSAYPYHDWNERITAECYAPNATTRILDGENRITQIVNNYSKISFNFGPTVLSWLREKVPDLYASILTADQESRALYGGHGCAIAQAYNHMIMPLANARDKETQALWGIADFEHRFGRAPEGMWLPETAVDTETLDVLAGLGIKYTILAPSQAAKFREIGAEEWEDVSGARIDPTRGYEFTTPSGKKIALFFYDGPISRAVAFEQLLNNGEIFGQRLLSAFSDERDWDELAHIATDGESYGHHHRYGEMALAYALHSIENKEAAQITNYGQYLEMYPPKHEVQIFDRTAWSCVHGVGRWERDCSCNSGGHGDWNQAWRGPLREALDWLRDEIAPKYEKRSSEFLKDPWKARNDYISIVLDRSDDVRSEFLAEHGRGELTEAEQVEVWKLLEMQRHAMLMYTSCGWFFDELSGIETVQVIEYAGRVVQLAQELLENGSLEEKFLERLANAQSNLPGMGNGRDIYLKFVKPAMVDLNKVAAHYALSSLFRNYTDEAQIYSYKVERSDFKVSEAGRLKFATGCARFTSLITRESGVLFFGALHLGDHNLMGGVKTAGDAQDFEQFTREAWDAFSRADAPQVLRTLDRVFGHTYSLQSLFRDEQRSILNQILGSTLEEAETAYRQLYEHNAPLLRYLGEMKTPLPREMQAAAQFALNGILRRAFESADMDFPRLRGLIEEAQRSGIELDTTTLEFRLRRTIEGLTDRLRERPFDSELLTQVTQLVEFAGSLPFPVNLWNVQNVCYALMRQPAEAVNGDVEKAAIVAAQYKTLAQDLKIRIE